MKSPFAPDVPRDALKVVLFLFLPLGVLTESCRILGVDLPRVDRAYSYYLLLVPFPGLTYLDYGACRSLLLYGAALITAFGACPRRLKKPFLILSSSWYIWRVLDSRCLLGYACAVLLLWTCLRRCRSVGFRIVGVCVNAALIACFVSHLGGYAGRIAGALAIMFLIKGLSIAVDTAEDPGQLELPDYILSLAGGFPCNLPGPYYSHAIFTRSFMARPYWAIAKDGIASIYSGLLKLAAVLAYEIWLLPLDLNFRSRPLLDVPSYPTQGQFWAHGFLAMVSYALRFVGAYQVLQGSNRLFGYDVADQFDRPWLAASPLDFWRRFSLHSRNYFLKYVFFPVYRRTRSGALGLLAALALSTLFNLLHEIDYHWAEGPQQVWDLIVTQGSYFLMFFLLCLSEMALRRRDSHKSLWGTAPAATRITRRFIEIAVTLVLMLLVHAPLGSFFHVASPPPNLIPGATPLARGRFVYGRMLLGH